MAYAKYRSIAERELMRKIGEINKRLRIRFGIPHKEDK